MPATPAPGHQPPLPTLPGPVTTGLGGRFGRQRGSEAVPEAAGGGRPRSGRVVAAHPVPEPFPAPRASSGLDTLAGPSGPIAATSPRRERRLKKEGVRPQMRLERLSKCPSPRGGCDGDQRLGCSSTAAVDLSQIWRPPRLASGEGPCLGCRRPPSHLLMSGKRLGAGSRGSLFQGSHPIPRPPPPGPARLPEAPSPNTIPLGVACII